jgi:putative endonuclease
MAMISAPLEINDSVMRFYYVYILESAKDEGWYTGYTSDLKKRLSEHQAGYTQSNKHRGPWKLVYYEACLSLDDAVAREKYLKSGMGKRYIRNRLKGYFGINT